MHKGESPYRRSGWIYVIIFTGIFLTISSILGFGKIINFWFYGVDLSILFITIGFFLLLYGASNFPLRLKPNNFDLNKIFPLNDQYVFFAGAGVSVNPPSNVPSAEEIMASLIKYFTLEEDTMRILKHKYLRYEHVIELIQRNVDPNLQFMDYFDEFKDPNLIHYFLANSIKMGHDVITTNYDYLIEYALCNLFSNRQLIQPIITPEDFQQFQNVNDLRAMNKLPLYKIHGSNRNIINETLTKESLVTTISALGKAREITDTFHIEFYKRKTINNLIKNKTLVFMGYSGSDSFDIVPVLVRHPTFSKIIWINHVPKGTKNDSLDDIETFSIRAWMGSKPKDIDELDDLLINIGSSSSIWKKVTVVKININTFDFIDKVLWSHLLKKIDKPNIIDKDVQKKSLKSWLKEKFPKKKRNLKLKLASNFYITFLEFDAAMNCIEKRLKASRSINNLKMEAYIGLDLANILYLKGHAFYSDAIQLLQETLRLNVIKQDKNLLFSVSTLLSTLALETNQHSIAFELLDNLVKISDFDKHRDYPIAICNLSVCNYIKYNNARANELLELALNAAVLQGNLESKAKILYKSSYMLAGFNKTIELNRNCIKLLEEAIKISEELSNFSLKHKCLKLMAKIHLISFNIPGWIHRKWQAYQLQKRLAQLDPLNYKPNYDKYKILIGIIIGIIIIELLIAYI